MANISLGSDDKYAPYITKLDMEIYCPVLRVTLGATGKFRKPIGDDFYFCENGFIGFHETDKKHLILKVIRRDEDE